MAKHAADNGGFFGLFRKKKEDYDFSDSSKNTSTNTYDNFYDGLKGDYTTKAYEDVEEKEVVSTVSENTQEINTINNFEVEENTNTSEIFGTDENSSEYEYESDYEYDYSDFDGGSKKIIIIFVILLVIAVVAIYFMFFRNSKKEEVPEENTTSQVVERMISSLSGFKVIGELKIDSLGIKQYILNSTSDEALEKGVGKIENGATLNTNGNFCIAGHNKEGMFKDLGNLIEGSEIVITDKNLKETTYVVKEFKEVAPDNLECLLQDQTKEIITLITCKEGATERFVVVAEKK